MILLLLYGIASPYHIQKSKQRENLPWRDRKRRKRKLLYRLLESRPRFSYYEIYFLPRKIRRLRYDISAGKKMSWFCCFPRESVTFSQTVKIWIECVIDRLHGCFFISGGFFRPWFCWALAVRTFMGQILSWERKKKRDGTNFLLISTLTGDSS